MLSKLRVQHYKSLFDTEIDLEPLTVFIGPNGSGKSNICEALSVLSDFMKRLMENIMTQEIMSFFSESLKTVSKNQQNLESKFWHGNTDFILLEVSALTENTHPWSRISVHLDYPQRKVRIGNNDLKYNTQPFTNGLRSLLVENKYSDSPIAKALKKVSIYDFSPVDISRQTSTNATMERTGEGIAYALLDILLANREGFDELQERLTLLVPNIKKIALPRGENNTFSLELVDKYSDHHIPAADISDGTLRLLAFLTALYQENTPSIICFEEIENGVHPWLLHKMMELLKIVSTEGITGNPVQVLITTHSPVLLNYVEPHQVRAVELDKEGKTQVHKLPVESVRFQKALEAYDGALGELWFTNVFGGNPT
ncbi:AAA family ATPase [Sphaerospermopsis torques-reginae]|uniref:ATP-binding protein n=1 Tax=Sphaerospermopsis torques-reginae ITEP-024 TaxID=984208 RepID=A0ABX8X3C2_9CYAN|nr:ATP-binding protein [Sphaerospermopsis torques-reginae]QYX33210.1 ATP-binding protein [Sphaerospermopsis torques-reginae ITEP-024]